MKNHIYIIGAGAIGKALGVFLHLNHRRVTLLRGSVDDGTSYQEKIAVLLDEQKLEAEIEINSLRNFSILDGIIVLTNKAFGNRHLAQVLREKTGHSPVILLQNGLGISRLL